MSVGDQFSNPTFIGTLVGAIIGFIIGVPLFFFTGPLVPIILVAGCVLGCTAAGGIVSLINDKVDTELSSVEFNEDSLNASTEHLLNALNQNTHLENSCVKIEEEINAKPSVVDAIINNISTTVSNWFISSINQDIELDDLAKDPEVKSTPPSL